MNDKRFFDPPERKEGELEEDYKKKYNEEVDRVNTLSGQKEYKFQKLLFNVH